MIKQEVPITKVIIIQGSGQIRMDLMGNQVIQDFKEGKDLMQMLLINLRMVNFLDSMPQEQALEVSKIFLQTFLAIRDQVDKMGLVLKI
jgi:hypothetical protein